MDTFLTAVRDNLPNDLLNDIYIRYKERYDKETLEYYMRHYFVVYGVGSQVKYVHKRFPFMKQLQRNQHYIDNLLCENYYFELDNEELLDKVNELFLEYYFHHNKYMDKWNKHNKIYYSKQDISKMRG
jgi:hypothetical protein